MADKLLVLSASRYGFKADDGKWLEGTKVHCLEPTSRSEDDQLGCKVVIFSTKTQQLFTSFQGQPLPAYYEIEYSISAGAKGVPVAVPTGAKFVARWDGAIAREDAPRVKQAA